MVMSKFCTKFFPDSVRVHYETGTILTTGGGFGSPGITFLQFYYASCVYDPVKPILGQFEGNILSFHKKNYCEKSNASLFRAVWRSLKMCLVEPE